VKVNERKAPGDGSKLEKQVTEQWQKLSMESARPRFCPASVSALARVSPDVDAEEALGTVPPKDRAGRFGTCFGNVVHQAIGLVLRNEKISEREAVERAAKLYGLMEHLAEAVSDVTRALEALGAAGLGGSPGPNLQLEYPVAGEWTEGQLANGYIDLVAVRDGHVTVIDFKTDTPPPGPVEQAYPNYAAQVGIYGKLLDAAGVLKGRRLGRGLLFTADGAIRWIEA
jgi:ATP-dependent helicase/nuclease subunit A